MKYEKSFSPIKIGNLTIKNRYCAGAVTSRFLLYGIRGEYNQNGMEFMTAQARGGFGLIVTGSNYGDQTVDPFNPLNAKPSPLYAPSVSGYTFRTVTRRVHRYGSKIFLQIAFGPGRMRDGKSCSVLPTLKDPSKSTEELTKEEIEKLIKGLVDLSVYAKNNDFDGVQIHAHFGYLLDQFEMTCTNFRKDEYGGEMDNRLKVYRDLIRGIKEACGEDFPVSIRMGAKTYMKSFANADLDGKNEFGRDIDETVKVCKKLESYGIDMFDLNSGTYESHYYCTNPYYMPKGYNIVLAEKVKKAVSVPVYCAGQMDDAEMAEKALQEGRIDGITVCRAPMLDTQYARKLYEGREEDIRPCIQCCCCEHNNLAIGVARCSANPAVMQEWTYGVPKTDAPKKVVIIGGGMAGLVAAHTAAKAGHQVEICDRGAQLGGRTLQIGMQPFKQGIARLRDWYIREITKLGVQILLGQEMTVDTIMEQNADVVILAQGSDYPMTDLPGAAGDATVGSITNDARDSEVQSDPKIISAIDVITGKEKPKGKVVIIGGGCVGAEIAYQLAAQRHGWDATDDVDIMGMKAGWAEKAEADSNGNGNTTNANNTNNANNANAAIKGNAGAESEGASTYKNLSSFPDITILEKGPQFVAGRSLTNDVRQMLTELNNYHNVDIRVNTEAVRIEGSNVTASVKSEGAIIIPADTIVLATGMTPAAALTDELKGKGLEIYEIGASTGAESILEVSEQAYEIARDL